MIKAKGVMGERDIYILGLSSQNMVKLMAGQPIEVKLDQIEGPPISIFLLGGPTNQSMAEQLMRHFPGVNVRQDPAGQV